MPKLKIKTVKSPDVDHDWNDLTLFEKLPIVKGNTVSREDWKRKRNRRRLAKQRFQEYFLGTHGQ